MKKAALILGVLFALVSSVVFWKLLHSGPMAAAALLPSSTIAVVEIPNIPAAITHWRQSELCKLTAEPEIETFLRCPLDFFYQQSGLFNSTMTAPMVLDLFHKLQPGRFFAALEISSQEPSWIVGCQFFGTNRSMEEVLNWFVKPLDASLETDNDNLLKAEEHHGELITTRTYSSFSLHTALHGNWCFVSNDLEALQKTLDLAAGRTLQKEALLSSLLYQENRYHLFSEGDLFCYALQKVAFEKIPYVSSLLMEHPLRNGAQALGASLRFIAEGMEERLFFNGNFSIKDQLSHRGLRFTQPTTLGFIERLNDWKEIAENLKNNVALPLLCSSFLTSIFHHELLQLSNLDLLSLASLLKPEMTFTMNWDPSNSFPTLFLTAPEADPEKTANFLAQAAAPLGASLQTLDQGNLVTISIPPITPTIQPTFASGHGLFLVSTDPLAIKQMSSSTATVPTLETTPDFAKNENLYHEANEAFFYFVSHEIFERAYSLVRPSLLVGSIFFPQTKAIIDFSKLPSATTIAKHLTPVVIAQSCNQEGALIQSRGPLSATPLFLIGKMLSQSFFTKQEASYLFKTDKKMENQH
ncbi:MAG: hypothetical protein ACOYK6_08140 [Chthoniobacterales bacterium]